MPSRAGASHPGPPSQSAAAESWRLPFVGELTAQRRTSILGIKVQSVFVVRASTRLDAARNGPRSATQRAQTRHRPLIAHCPQPTVAVRNAGPGGAVGILDG